jgi:hypothetical protein
MIKSPLYIELWKKKIRKYYINLNRIKNLHFIVYNNLKKEYKKQLKPQLASLEKINWPIQIIITYYNPTKRKSDLDNVCCYQSKFFQDALVEEWIIEEDNYEYIKKITYKYWGYIKNINNCEIKILPI